MKNYQIGISLAITLFALGIPNSFAIDYDLELVDVKVIDIQIISLDDTMG